MSSSEHKIKPGGGQASQAKTPANAGVGGDKPNVFDAQGAIGKQFTAGGAIGSVGETVGGPFAKDGMIGKNFNEDGSVGGSVQNTLGGKSAPSN